MFEWLKKLYKKLTSLCSSIKEKCYYIKEKCRLYIKFSDSPYIKFFKKYDFYIYFFIFLFFWVNYMCSKTGNIFSFDFFYVVFNTFYFLINSFFTEFLPRLFKLIWLLLISWPRLIYVILEPFNNYNIFLNTWYEKNIYWTVFYPQYLFYIFWGHYTEVLYWVYLHFEYVFSWSKADCLKKFEIYSFELWLIWVDGIKHYNIYEFYNEIHKFQFKYFPPFNMINKFQYYYDLFELTKPFIGYSWYRFKLSVLALELPIFVYFYIFFIFTTISSLFLLSFLGLYGVFVLNLISVILFWFSSIVYFNIFFIDNMSYNINLGKWFVLNLNYTVYFNFYIDPVSFSFMFLTLTIAVFVYIYAFSYFRYEPNVERLLLLINCFVISMICLVISGNFFVLFLGWELIGLTSFFLINFWSTRISTLKSAFKAFIFNKVSDVALLSSILLVYFCFNETNILIFNNQVSYYNSYYLNIIDYNIPFLELTAFFFIMCAFIKSAQFGFHTWLPDSMEAPVPASALIHSATLVSAGIFLLLRFTQMFEFSIYAYYIIPLIGSFTAFFGGLSSAYQSDIKRILAYSTISHCGFLMVCYSTYIVEYTILYLYIHGFFKAAVFLCVGNVIRFSRNCQDFRRMGGFYKYLPFECIASFICLINLSGLPFTIGFYIKHLLLIGIYLENYFLYFIVLNILGGAVYGLIYSYRLFYFVFFDFKKSKKIIYNQANRINLYSKYYSNTTLASNLSILGLIIVSYIVSLYLLNIFLNKSSFGDGLDIYSINSSQYDEFIHPLLSLLTNISYFNWFLLIIIFIIITASWRFIFNYFRVFNNIFHFFIFSFFFSFFYYSLI